MPTPLAQVEYTVQFCKISKLRLAIYDFLMPAANDNAGNLHNTAGDPRDFSLECSPPCLNKCGSRQPNTNPVNLRKKCENVSKVSPEYSQRRLGSLIINDQRTKKIAFSTSWACSPESTESQRDRWIQFRCPLVVVPFSVEGDRNSIRSSHKTAGKGRKTSNENSIEFWIAPQQKYLRLELLDSAIFY